MAGTEAIGLLVADELLAAEEHARIVPLLCAMLEDDPVAMDGLDHYPALRDGPGERLLAIDVLPGPGGGTAPQTELTESARYRLTLVRMIGRNNGLPIFHYSR